jgi:hypothetical protein
MEHINENKCANDRTFITVGVDDECDVHFKWSQESERLRECLVSSLEESDLKAEFVQRDFYEELDDWYIYGPPKDCLSWISLRNNETAGFDDCEVMAVIRVEVPMAVTNRRTK